MHHLSVLLPSAPCCPAGSSFGRLIRGTRLALSGKYVPSLYRADWAVRGLRVLYILFNGRHRIHLASFKTLLMSFARLWVLGFQSAQYLLLAQYYAVVYRSSYIKPDCLAWGFSVFFTSHLLLHPTSSAVGIVAEPLLVVMLPGGKEVGGSHDARLMSAMHHMRLKVCQRHSCHVAS